MNKNIVDIKKEVLEIKDRYPHLSLDNAFVAWFLRAFIVDCEEAAIDSIKGISCDKGVDAIYFDHEARIVFVLQGKYRQGDSPSNENRSDVLALADLGRVLLLDDSANFNSLLLKLDPALNEPLKKVRALIKKKEYRLCLYYVTSGKVSKTHSTEAATRIEDWDNAEIRFYTRAELKRLMQDYIEGVSPPVPSISLPIYKERLFNFYDDNTNISSWVLTMHGKDVGKIYNEVGIRLFARNIRGYLGDTNINRGMDYTIHREPEYFWYFNNGVTIVCDEAREITEKGRKTLRVKNAQIINGQQTTRTLALHPNTSSTILAKVIVIPRENEEGQKKYSHLISEIVSATNWQNAISQSDLKSNDPEQVRIERELRKLGYIYLRKKQNKSESRKIYGVGSWKMIKKEDLARSMAACLLDPYEIRLGKDHLFEDEIYSEIFNPRISASEYLTCFFLVRVISSFASGDVRKGYAKWLVAKFIWDRIGKGINTHENRKKFKHIFEREYRYKTQWKPLYGAIRDIYITAMAFYRSKRHTKDGVLDESLFFKKKNLHTMFERYWSSNKNPNRKDKEYKLKMFVKNINGLALS